MAGSVCIYMAVCIPNGKMRLAKLGKKRPDLSEKMRGNQNAKKLAKQ